MYGEWTYSKHSVFYDCLPHHFHEFRDRREGVFLSTPRRHALLGGSPVLSVPVLYAGPMPTRPAQLRARLLVAGQERGLEGQPSASRGARRAGLGPVLAPDRRRGPVGGLYLKIEDDRQVLARYKFVRRDFVQTILDSGSHHASRPSCRTGWRRAWTSTPSVPA